MMVVKGASRCRFEKNHGKFFGLTKKIERISSLWNTATGICAFSFEDFSQWGQKKKTHHENEQRVLFFGIIPSSDTTGKKGS